MYGLLSPTFSSICFCKIWGATQTNIFLSPEIPSKWYEITSLLGNALEFCGLLSVAFELIFCDWPSEWFFVIGLLNPYFLLVWYSTTEICTTYSETPLKWPPVGPATTGQLQEVGNLEGSHYYKTNRKRFVWDWQNEEGKVNSEGWSLRGVPLCSML